MSLPNSALPSSGALAALYGVMFSPTESDAGALVLAILTTEIGWYLSYHEGAWRFYNAYAQQVAKGDTLALLLEAVAEMNRVNVKAPDGPT